MSPELLIKKYEIHYLDQNSDTETIQLNQTFAELNKNCIDFKETKDLNFSLIYSPSRRISVVKLSSRKKLNDEFSINLFIADYLICTIKISTSSLSSIYVSNSWVFICELNSLEGYKKEKFIPQSMHFSFKSDKIFSLSICRILVYEFGDKCKTPDIPFPASIRRLDQRRIQFYENSQEKKYRIIGETILKCTFEGYWDNEPPIFEPIIQCNINSSAYKSIQFQDFEFFNETEVAVIDSKIIFQCNNEENSSKFLVAKCDKNGLWVGDDYKCKMN